MKISIAYIIFVAAVLILVWSDPIKDYTTYSNIVKSVVVVEPTTDKRLYKDFNNGIYKTLNKAGILNKNIKLIFVEDIDSTEILKKIKSQRPEVVVVFGRERLSYIKWLEGNIKLFILTYVFTSPQTTSSNVLYTPITYLPFKENVTLLKKRGVSTDSVVVVSDKSSISSALNKKIKDFYAPQSGVAIKEFITFKNTIDLYTFLKKSTEAIIIGDIRVLNNEKTPVDSLLKVINKKKNILALFSSYATQNPSLDEFLLGKKIAEAIVVYINGETLPQVSPFIFIKPFKNDSL